MGGWEERKVKVGIWSHVASSRTYVGGWVELAVGGGLWLARWLAGGWLVVCWLVGGWWLMDGEWLVVGCGCCVVGGGSAKSYPKLCPSVHLKNVCELCSAMAPGVERMSRSARSRWAFDYM